MVAAITPSLPVPRSRWPKIIAYILLGLLALLLLAVALFVWTVRSALPQLDGVIQVSGLKVPVTVTRDGHGVPTIHASNFDALFFAQGYITAQDRLWQMDVMRRYAAGELSEILGSDLVAHDREQRILGMRQAARKIVELATPQDRANFEAYARGVNAYIQSHQGNLPLEFRILHYLPKPWTPEDSTLIVAHMVKDLNHGQFETALTREKILAKLGPELTAELYVNRSSHDRPPVPLVAPTPQVPRNSDDDDEGNGPIENRNSVVENSVPGSRGEEDARLVVGSNNWVVSGAHTVSGKPLLSNDMHLGHQMPNLWYEAHLSCGDFDVAGVTLPGLPYVVVGHNQSIAWGFTNVGPTVEDVYIETFNEAGQYKTPHGWKYPEHREETIHVKGSPDVIVDVMLTRHGPIISDLIGEKRKVALRWTLQDGARSPLFLVNAAQNWDQFRRAFSWFDAPGQNVVYADVNGNIGYQATGKVPIRATGDGSLPEDGSTDRYEWTGYIPYQQMPSIYNPASGIIATANSRIIPDKYPYSISHEWEAPWRSERIYRVLESGKKFATADMLALQTDTYSAMDHFTAQQLVAGVDRVNAASVRAKQAVEIMRSWDGRMSADSAAPAIEYQARQELVRLLLEGKLGPGAASFHYSWGMQSVWLENVLRDRPVRWLSEKYPDYDELLNAAVEAAVNGPAAPKDLNSWKWGGMNSLEIQHPIFGRIPGLWRWSGTGLKPQSGSGYAVKAVTSSHGPSERFTADLANLDASTLNTVTGQSGNLFSPYYLDQWKAWYEGTTFALPFSVHAVQSSAEHRLVLQPAK